MLVIDGANVVGSRPDGWWRDRPGAAQRLHAQLSRAADQLDPDRVVLVLEGAARSGVPAGSQTGVETVHAAADGDTTIARLATEHAHSGVQVVVVTADRALAAEVERVGAAVRGPRWLWDRLREQELTES